VRALELILILLAVAAALQLIGKWLAIPRPALFVLGGLLLAVTPGLPFVELPPDVVFLIFVPPLIYLAAFNTSYRDFRRNLGVIARMGVLLVLITMSVVAFAAHAIVPEMTWGAAFTLGAIISPPDAVAVTAVIRRLGVPKIVTTLLEGESLLNDATAFVAYRMAVAAVVSGSFSLWAAGMRFIWTAAGAILLGLAVGWLVARLRRMIRKEPIVEITVSLLTPYVAFIPAEKLGLASVLSVVAAGLYLGREGPKIIGAATRLQATSVWEVLNFLLEGLIFVFIGLELPIVRREMEHYPLGQLLAYAAALSAVIVVVRMAYVLPSAYFWPLLGRLRGKRVVYPPFRQVLFVGWAGIRGGDSLVIALALPLSTATGQPFPARSLIIFLTFSVILVTLVLQGLTLPFVIRLLALRPDGGERKEEESARLKSARAGIHRLNQLSERARAPSHVVNDLLKRYEHRTHHLTKDDDEDAKQNRTDAEAYRRLRLEMIAAERAEVIRLRDEGEIGDEVLRRVQRDLDLEEVLLMNSEEAMEPTRHDLTSPDARPHATRKDTGTGS
jgi:Na+/H+ antiporter